MRCSRMCRFEPRGSSPFSVSRDPCPLSLLFSSPSPGLVFAAYSLVNEVSFQHVVRVSTCREGEGTEMRRICGVGHKSRPRNIDIIQRNGCSCAVAMTIRTMPARPPPIHLFLGCHARPSSNLVAKHHPSIQTSFKRSPNHGLCLPNSVATATATPVIPSPSFLQPPISSLLI